MPNYKKHLVVGSITYAAMTYISVKTKWIPIDLHLQLQTLGACLIGSLFPDIDTKSKIQKYIYITVIAVSIYLLMSGFEYQGCLLATVSLFPLIVSHRGLFHRMWFILMGVGLANFICYVSRPAWYLNCFWISVFFVLGTISHIWLDMGYKKLFSR